MTLRGPIAVSRRSHDAAIVTTVAQKTDRTGEKPVVLWRDQRFTRVISYEVTPDTTNYFDREVQSMERLARDFARGLVVTILEGF